MPNWCNNNITIEGPISKIEPIWNKATADEDHSGLLNAMVPMPVELRDTKKGSGDELQTEVYDGATNWYDWSVNRWGTKWDVDTEGLEFIDHKDGTAEITGWFDSAWAPPTEAYRTFTEENPDCSISASYHEGGMDFGGFWVNGDDEYLEGLYEEYKLPEDEQSDLFKRIDEEYNLSESYDMWEEENEED